MQAIVEHKSFQQLIRWVTGLLSVLFLINMFWQNDFMNTVLAGLSILLVIIGLLIMNRINQVIAGILLIVGAIFLYQYQVPLIEWRAAILKNISTLALIFFAPVLAMPFFYKPYQAELKNVCSKYISSPGMFLLLSAFASFFLGFYMSMAGIALIYVLLEDIAKEYKCKRSFLMTLVAGNGMTNVCCPATGAGIVLPATGITYTSMLTYGIIISFVLILVSVLIYSRDAKKEGAVRLEKRPDTVVQWSNIGMLLFLAVLLSGIIICIDKYMDVPLLGGVALLATPFALIFALIQNKLSVFKTRLIDYSKTSMLKNPSTMTIVVVAGFAGEGLKRAEFIDYVLDFFAANQGLSMIFPFILMTIIVLLGIIGVHPFATVATLGAVLTGSMLGTSQIGLAMIYLTGASIALSVTPFGALTNLASAQSGMSVWEFTAWRAWKFILACLVIGTVMIDIFTLLGI